MLNQPTIEKLQAMKLHGMAEAFQEQIEIPESSQLSFEERLGLLVDRQWTWKEARALTRRLQLARFKERGVVEDINYQHPRGLDRKLIRTLATSDWVRLHHNVLLVGPTGIGKSWLACALAHKACRDGFFALHKRMAELFRDLIMARADGSIGQFLLKLARIDVLVLDDFAMAPLSAATCWRSATTAINAAPPSSPASYLSPTGTTRSVAQLSPTASWTDWFTMLTASS